MYSSIQLKIKWQNKIWPKKKWLYYYKEINEWIKNKREQQLEQYSKKKKRKVLFNCLLLWMARRKSVHWSQPERYHTPGVFLEALFGSGSTPACRCRPFPRLSLSFPPILPPSNIASSEHTQTNYCAYRMPYVWKYNTCLVYSARVASTWSFKAN